MITLQDVHALKRRVEELERTLHSVYFTSLLDVRRACFAPEIGTRLTEEIRLNMADAIRRLEDLARAGLRR